MTDEAPPIITSDTYTNTIRHALTLIGGIAIGKGWITQDVLTAALGVVGPLVGLAWALKSSTIFSKVAFLQKQNVVKQVVLDASAPGAQNIAAAIPGSTVVAK